MKVISFRISDQTYDELKSLNGTFKEIIGPLVENYLHNTKKEMYTPVYSPENLETHEEIAKWLDSLEITVRPRKRGF